jgi:hypothetical protein
MHQLQYEALLLWLDRGQKLACTDYGCGYRDFSGFDESIPQKDIRLISAFPHFEIVGFVEKERVDWTQIGRRRRRNFNSSRRVAGKREIGMLTRPKLMVPFQRALIDLNIKGTPLRSQKSVGPVAVA